MTEEDTEKPEPNTSVCLNSASEIASLAKTLEGISRLGDTLLLVPSVADRMRELVEVLKAAGSGSLIASLQAVSEGLSTFIEHNPPRELAIKYGWPPMFDIDFRYLSKVYRGAEKLDDDKKQQYFDDYITAYFRGHGLDRLLIRWRKTPFLTGTDRLRIIEDAFQAHKDGKYSIASPAMLAQTEGLVFEWLIDSEEEKPVSKYQYEDIHKKLKQETGEGLVIVLASEALSEFVDKYGLYRTSDEDDTGYNHDVAYAISRNKILHGTSTEYCLREDISLRHILWLDSVIKLIEFSLKPEAPN
jgi:hypothetical protein